MLEYSLAAGVYAASRQAALLVLIVGMLSLALRRTSPTFRHALWCVVLLRLCIPFGLSLPVGCEERLLSVATQGVGLLAGDGEALRPESTQALTETASRALPYRTIWLLGAGLMFALILYRVRRASRFLRSCREVRRKEVIALLDRLKARMGLKTPISLLASAAGGGPFVAGLFHPRIVLPEDMALQWSDETLEPVLLHELAHISRGDLLGNAVQLILQSVYWFHPLVWFANRRMRQLAEESCDDIAIHQLDGRRARFGRAFLGVIEESQSQLIPSWNTLGLAERRNSLGRRVVRIMQQDYKNHGRMSWHALIGMVILGCAAFTFAAAGKGGANERLLDEAEKLYAQKDYREAIEVYRRIYEQYPKWNDASHALMMIGICHDWLGEPQEAIEAFEFAAQEYPDLAGWSEATYFYLGEAYHRAGRTEEALTALKKCAKLSLIKRTPDTFPHKEATALIAKIEGNGENSSHE